jgi:hypothetical protein
MTFVHIGLNLRRLGKKDMQEFLRIASLPTRLLRHLGIVSFSDEYRRLARSL